MMPELSIKKRRLCYRVCGVAQDGRALIASPINQNYGMWRKTCPLYDLTTSMDNLKQPLSDPAAQLDLTTCDREQIQFPDAIMPHGVLLVVAPGQWQIIGASANSLSLLGIEATQIMRQPLGHVTGAVVMETIVSALSGLAAAARPCLIGCFAMPHSGQLCCVLGHRSGDVFILEFEAIGSEVDAASVIGRTAQVHNSLAAIQATDCWQAGMALLVRELKHWTGFASVLGVRFLDDGSFQTIAEARDAHMPAYLDKRFPRSDIPEPGRQKCCRCRSNICLTCSTNLCRSSWRRVKQNPWHLT